MNAGIVGLTNRPPVLPRPLLGQPTPVPTIDYKTPTFDPRSIDGCGVWFDATDISTLTFNGSNVSEWRSKADGGVVASQGTAASQPTWTTVDGWGSVPTSGSIGVGLSFNAAGLNLARNVSGLSVFLAHRTASVANQVPFALSRNDINNSVRAMVGIGFTQSAGLFEAGGRRIDGGSYVQTSAGTAVTNKKYVQSAVFDHQRAVLLLYLNGAMIAANRSWQTQGNTVDTASLGGGVLGSSVGHYIGSLAEVLVYRRPLPQPEWAAVDEYLRIKWGV